MLRGPDFKEFTHFLLTVLQFNEKAAIRYHMHLRLKRNLCVVTSLCLLLNAIGFISILALSDDEHRISLFIKQGFHHIVLSHSNDHQPLDIRLDFESSLNEAGHEFRLPSIPAEIHHQSFKSNFECIEFGAFPIEITSWKQPFATSELFESDIGALKKATTVLRI